MAEFLAPLREAFTALVAGVAGAGLAWAWFAWYAWAALLALVVALALALLMSQTRPALIHGDPQKAVRRIDNLTVVYMGLVAAGSAVGIVIAVSFSWSESAVPQTKATVGALSTAITTFVGAILVSGDKVDDAIGSLARRRFQAAFDQVPEHSLNGATYGGGDGDAVWHLEAKSRAIRAITEDFGSIEGWGRASRHERARVLRAALHPEQRVTSVP